MSLTINSTEFNLFVQIITSSNPENPPKNLLPLFDFYETIKNEVKKKGTKIMDLVSIGKRFYPYVSTGISSEEYQSLLGKLAMYEFMVNYNKWPEFHTKEEKRKEQQLNIGTTHFPPSEKEHFTEELMILGESAADIMGEGTYHLIPLIELHERIKNNSHRHKRASS